MEKTVHILLADDDRQVLSALRLLLEQETVWLVTNEFHNSMEMMYHFENTSQWLEPCTEEPTSSHASVLLIDWELPGFQPQKDIKEIRRLCPQIKIVGLSVMMSAHREILASQLDAFVSKSDAPECVIAALQDLMLKLSPNN
jgi:DNA-binding NarL/FixJ family response regulator